MFTFVCPPRLGKATDQVAGHSHGNPLSLSLLTHDDLVQHISAQTLKINQLINNPGCFSDLDGSLASWAVFKESLWRKNLKSEKVEQKDGTVYTIANIPETVPKVLYGGTSRILVRTEYEETERAALEANTRDVHAFLVTGQPGIGKSAFLTWLLIRRLSLKLPTVLQVEESYAILFHEAGVSQFRHLNTIVPYNGLTPLPGSPGSILALVDCVALRVGPRKSLRAILHEDMVIFGGSPSVWTPPLVAHDAHISEAARSVCQRRIASRHVFEMLWDRYMKYQVSDMAFFYNLFQDTPHLSTAAGWIFELRMHQLLRRGTAINLFPIGGESANTNFVWKDYTATKKGENPTVIRLTPSEEYCLDEKARLVVGHYYRPRAADFPTVDSLVLVHPPCESPILLMFRIMRDGTEDGINEQGLQRIGELDFPWNTRRYYVVVTPCSVRSQVTVSLEYFKDKGDPGKVFPVFHCPVSADTLFR